MGDTSVMSESFWDFSVRIYQKPGVKQACLDLQDDYGLDVVFLFFCIWVGISRGEFEDGLYAKGAQFSTSWATAVVVPLRGARRWVGDLDAAQMELRERIKAAELDAERFQIITLEECCSMNEVKALESKDQLRACSNNIKRYCADAGVSLDELAVKKHSLLLSKAIEGATIGLASSEMSVLGSLVSPEKMHG